MNGEPTFVFRNGKAYAMFDGQVVASADDVAELEHKLEEDGVPADTRHTHIMTPNGLRGQILGRVKGIWGDEVTVRLENGNITRYPVSGDLRFSAEKEPVAESKMGELEAVISKTIAGTRGEIVERIEELQEAKKIARSLLSTQSADEASLHQIIVQADYELTELADAMRHLNDQDVEAFEPPAPYRMEVTPQGGPNQKADTFLDGPLAEMQAEAENTDFTQLMDEGPERFVAELDTPALADAGTVRSMASSFIRTKTAMAEPKLRDKYEAVWLDRVEGLRRQELANRKETIEKEAAAEEVEYLDSPDESLFT